jgi:hypothetical protein
MAPISLPLQANRGGQACAKKAVAKRRRGQSLPLAWSF